MKMNMNFSSGYQHFLFLEKKKKKEEGDNPHFSIRVQCIFMSLSKYRP